MQYVLCYRLTGGRKRSFGRFYFCLYKYPECDRIKKTVHAKSLCTKDGARVSWQETGVDMAYLFWLFMAAVCYLLGKGALSILYRQHKDREMTKADNVLTGYLINIGLTEAAHLGTVLLGRPLSDCVKWYLLGLGICLAASAAMLLWKRYGCKENLSGWKKHDRKHLEQTNSGHKKFGQKKEEQQRRVSADMSAYTREQQILFVIFGILVLLQIISIITGERIYLEGDMTLETVNSFLNANGIYRVNPLTGEPYLLGLPLRLKILCLPTQYAVLSRIFHLSAEQVVWNIMPAVTLLLGYLAYGLLAKALFPESRVKRAWFMIAAALLIGVGDYLYGMDGFGAMHSGFRGVSIRALVLIPYTIGLVLRRKWKPVVLCILAEACIVWTLYGMGACFFIAAVLSLICLFTENRKLGRNSFQTSDSKGKGSEKGTIKK